MINCPSEQPTPPLNEDRVGWVQKANHDICLRRPLLFPVGWRKCPFSFIFSHPSSFLGSSFVFLVECDRASTNLLEGSIVLLHARKNHRTIFLQNLMERRLTSHFIRDALIMYSSERIQLFRYDAFVHFSLIKCFIQIFYVTIALGMIIIWHICVKDMLPNEYCTYGEKFAQNYVQTRFHL